MNCSAESLMSRSPSHTQENEHHFYYEVFRAASIDELIPKSVGCVAPAETAKDTRIKELEAALIAARADALVAARAEKEEEIELLRARIAQLEKA